MKPLASNIVDAIRQALDTGQQGIDIARRFGVSKSTVSRIAGGSRHGRRIPRSEKADIRLARHQGQPLKLIAARHGIAMSTVSRICNEHKATTLTHGGVGDATTEQRPE